MSNRLNILTVVVLVVIFHSYEGTDSVVASIDSKPRLGFLAGDFPPINEIYDPSSGHALLVPGVPLSPPAPKEDAVRIGIIDSGIIDKHPQLRPLILAQKSFVEADPTDRIGHGTSVALKIIGHPIDGTGYPAILSARVTDNYGVPKVEAVIAAINWVIAEGALIVNLSLGFLGEESEYADLCKVIARNSDTIFVSAAGNFGPEVKVFPASCSAETNIAVGEAYEGVPTQSSGLGDIYAPGDLELLTLWQYHFDIGMQAAKAGYYSRARQEFQTSLAAKKNVEALFQLALLDIQEDNLVAAAERLNAAIDMESKLAILYSHLGAIRFLQERFDDAEDLLRKALELDEDDQRTYFNLGQTMLELSRPREALSIFEQLRKLNSDYPSLDSAIAEAATRSREDSQE